MDNIFFNVKNSSQKTSSAIVILNKNENKIIEQPNRVDSLNEWQTKIE